MGYDTKTLTIQGAKLLAQEHGSSDKLMFDNLITSSNVVQSGTNLAELGISDFGTYLTFPINSLSYTDQQFTVKSVLSNNPSGDGKTNIISSDTPVKLVGIVGHIGSGDKTLISVAYATNGPYTIPAYDGTEISAAFTFVQAFDPTTDNSGKFVINPSAYALVADLDKKVDKADAVTISGDQVILDQKTFKNAPIDQKTGLPYLTEKDVPQPDLSNYATQQQLATKADDSTVVHTADMRKPANQVASIDEVNTKQDKIGYTPADDSTVLHNSTKQVTGTDMNTLLTGGYYQVMNGTNGFPGADSWTIYQVIPINGQNGVQIAYGTDNTVSGMRSWNTGPGHLSFNSWVQFADDSKVVHSTDMRKPANQVASIDEVNAKQDKLDYTPANAANVVDRNPDTGVVSEPVDFTKLTVNGGKTVATRDYLNNYYHYNDSDQSALAAAKSATVPGIFWFEEV